MIGVDGKLELTLLSVDVFFYGRDSNDSKSCRPFMSDLQENDDASLILSSLEGDLKAFDQLVDRHQKMITRCLFRFCPHQSDLEDLVQDTFIKAFRKLAQWQPKAPFENWLRKIAYNTGYDYYRKNSRNPASISSSNVQEAEETVFPISSGPNQRSDFERTEQVQEILALLDSEERMLLTLQYLEELPLAEIAQQLGWGLSKTKVKSFRARKRLKKLLTNHGIAQETKSTIVG